jgi:hypothetical protein
MVESTNDCPYFVGEHVDCLDSVSKWCNAEVMQIDQTKTRLFVHYTGFSSKYDEWIEYAP